MASTDTDIAVAQRAIADDLHVAPGNVKVRALSVEVPGITVFSAAVDSGKTGRHVTRTGIVEAGALYREVDAMSRVARAWGYGAHRTVPPSTLAHVFATLHSETAGASAFIDRDTVAVYRKVSGPRRAAVVDLPRETTVEGNPAVVYCITSNARGVPFSVVTAIVKPDYQIELRSELVVDN